MKITVYYDGLCHLCSREINHYKTMSGSEKIQFVDITSALFSAKKEGLNPQAIHKIIHVRDQSGNIKLGVDAFICIWQQLPALSIAAKLAEIKLIKFFLRFFYAIFAIIRPWLPKKSCQNSPFCETNTKSL